jgi:diacylglycerol kinase (ATP)
MEVALVFNPVSGSGRARRSAEAIARGLSARGIAPRLVESQRGPAEAWLRPHLRGVRALVVAGGDGGVRMCAQEAALAAVPLWQAPCGTENLVARAFGTSTDPARIADAVAAQRVRSIDLADAAGEPCVIMASVGFDAEVVHALSARRTGGISHLSYARPILELLRSWSPPELAWEIDGEREWLGRGMVVVGNLAEYGARLNPAASAVPDDGELDAVFLPAGSAAGLLPWIPLLRFGLHLRHPSVRERRGRRIELHADRPVRLQVDGDAAGTAAGARRIEIRLAAHRLPMLLSAG